MDNSNTKNQIFTTKAFNGETVNYWAVYSLCAFLFLALKQVLKIVIGFSAPIAMIVSLVFSFIVLFLLERKYVFNHKSENSFIKSALLCVFRCGVDFGFFKISEFFLVTLIGGKAELPYFLSFFIFGFFNYYFDKLIVFNSSSVAKNNKNGRLYKLFFDNRFVFLSLLVSLICIMFIYIVFQLFPFGDNTVMRMDLYHQYGPLFAEFYDKIVNHESFIYSWESGGGSSFLGNYFNYLSSPISFAVFLFDRKNISFAITALVVIKSVLASGTFTYYLKKSIGSHNYATAAFGTFYAFCGYFLAYYWNIMWIDGMILLPLIALGIEYIIKDGKPVLYIATLTLMLFSSYYIGFMMCIFAILYFLCYFLANYSFNSNIKTLSKDRKHNIFTKAYNNRFLNRGITFALSSVLAGALCACTLVPVYFILQSCSATSDTFPSTFESYFNLIDMISSHLAGLETTIRSSGDDVLPNIYCGILTIILVPLYITNKEIRLKEKAMYVLLLLCFVFSFDNNVMNFIWHAFHFPNDLPYRFSFMYSFIMLIMAYKALKHFRAIRYQDIAIVGMVWLAIIMFYQKFPTNKVSEITIYISLAFVIVWTGVLLMIKKGHMSKFVIGVTIVAITFCESIVANSNSYEFTVKNDDYIVNYDDYKDSIKYTKDNDKGLYREELSYLDTRMDPCLYGYNGMSIFSSMAYENYSQTQYSLGMFGNRINSYTYNTQTPVYNMLYGIKYLIQTGNTTQPCDEYYKKLYNSKKGNSEVYKNKYYLPLAFETANDIKDWDASEGNPFDVQQDLLSKACGVGNVFEEMEYVSCVGNDVECDEATENGTYFFTKDSPDQSYGSVDLTLKSKTDSNVYVYITSPEVENVNYTWGNDRTKYQSITEPYILDLGRFKADDEINISLDLAGTNSDNSYFEIYAYTVNEDILNAAYEMLSLGALDVEWHNATTIYGTMNAGYDGFIYTSIPYDEGWTITIDGQKAKTFDVNSQLATTVKQGEHKVVLKYRPKGQMIGLAVTVASWILIALWCVIRKLFANRKIDLVKLSKKSKK